MKARRGARLLVGEALWSPGTGLLEPEGGAAVLVDADGGEVEKGPAAELIERHAGVPRDEGDGLLMPGLVDCHVHLECAVLAGQVPGGVGMAGWIARLLKVRSTYTLEQTEAAAREAARAIHGLGTVAIGDVCTFLVTAPILAEAGLRGASFLEILAMNEEEARAAFADARRRLEAAPATEAIDVRMVPHSPYGTTASVIRALAGPVRSREAEGPVEVARPAFAGAGVSSEALSELEVPGVYAAGLALEGGMPSVPEGAWEEPAPGVRSVHAAEHTDEVDWLANGEGAFAPILTRKGAVSPGETPVRHLDSLGAIGAETLLVHLVVASPEELALAASRGATAVLCPRSNLHIGGRLPDLAAIRAAGMPYVLGTDSLASTPDHDLLGEVRTLAAAHTEVPLGELLAAATTGGAAALGLRVHPWVRIAKNRIPELFGGAR
ncbi:MAG TPA: amidohydrolase family protein [Vulgatibacter sp.]|nr:amidohydrolase family protein [Vulgatibacter sp.]